ncbi:MAG: hypothetical protein ACRC41_05075 [Sarcina sp.]
MTKEIEVIPCPNEKCTGELVKIYDCKFIDAGEGEKACMYCCSQCLEEFLGSEKVEE